jgi:hypothetical protein
MSAASAFVRHCTSGSVRAFAVVCSRCLLTLEPLFLNGQKSLAHQMNFRVNKGNAMKLRLRHSYSFFIPLLLLAAVFAAAQRSCAIPQSAQNASASFSKLQSQAENGDAVAQYKLAQSYLGHDPMNENYQSGLKWLRASAAQGNASA